MQATIASTDAERILFWSALIRDSRIAPALGLGFTSGMPFLLTYSTQSAWLTDAGVPLADDRSAQRTDPRLQVQVRLWGARRRAFPDIRICIACRSLGALSQGTSKLLTRTLRIVRLASESTTYAFYCFDFFSTRFFGPVPMGRLGIAPMAGPSISECFDSDGIDPRFIHSIRIVVEVPQQDLDTFQNATLRRGACSHVCWQVW